MTDERFARAQPNPKPLDTLKIPDWDIRSERNEDDIRTIAASMQEEAQMQPILLGDESNGQYEIVDGVHRYLAAKRLEWPDVDTMRLTADVEDQTAAALSNLGRVDMSARDTHQVVAYYLEHTDLDQQDIADKLGVTPSTIVHHAKVHRGWSEVQQQYMAGNIQLKAAAALSEVPDRDVALDIAEYKQDRGLNQKQVKAMAKNAKARLEAGDPARDAVRAAGHRETKEDVQEAKRQHEAQEDLENSNPGEQARNPPGPGDAVAGPQSPPSGPQGPTNRPPDTGGTQPASQPSEGQQQSKPCLCGEGYTGQPAAVFNIRADIAEQLGVQSIEFCENCGPQAFQGINALQEQLGADQ